VNLAAAVLWALAQASTASDRPPLPSAELKALKESNLFSPYRAKNYERPVRRDERRSEARSEPVKPKPVSVTGIVFDAASGAHKALIEDRNAESLRRLKEPVFAKAGDEVLGFKVIGVSAGTVKLALPDGAEKELAPGDALPEDPNAAAAGTVEAAKPAEKPLEEGVKNEVLERLRSKNKKKDRPQDDP
jgi:hypothetical protein